MARIWVVGGRGMLGQAVVGKLADLGHAVWATGREIDIGQLEPVLSFARARTPSHIINCAAHAKVDACETQLEAAKAANTLGPRHLAQAAAVLAVPIVHVSTDYVFDGAATRPYAETATCRPLGVYGRTKYAGEQAFWQALAAAPQAAIGYVVRTSWLFGHGGAHFVQTMLRLMAQKSEIAVVADQIGRPTFCADLAGAIVQLVGLEPSALSLSEPGVYHFANTGAVSWCDFAQGILAAARCRQMALTCANIRAIGTQDFPTPAQRPAYSVLCTDKITQAFGYAPRRWQQALDDYLAQHEHRPQTAASTLSASASPNVSGPTPNP